MSYSLQSFFPNDENCVIHLLQNKKQNISFFIYKKQSQYICHLFETTSLLKQLLHLQPSQYSIYLFLRIIETHYRIGITKDDINDEDLNECFKNHHYELIATPKEERKFKPPISDEPKGSGSYGSVYLLLTETGGDTNYVIKIYFDVDFIEYGKKVEHVNLEKNDEEQKISLLASKKGIGPHVDKTWGCIIKVELLDEKIKERMPFRFIVMEKYDENLMNYIFKLSEEYWAAIKKIFETTDRKSYDKFTSSEKGDLEKKHGFPNEIIDVIKEKLWNMKIYRIQHNDLHLGNIMLKFKDGKEMKEFDKLAIVDFGSAEILSTEKQINATKDIDTLIKKLKNIGYWIGELVIKKLLEALILLRDEIWEKYFFSL